MIGYFAAARLSALRVSQVSTASSSSSYPQTGHPEQAVLHSAGGAHSPRTSRCPEDAAAPSGARRPPARDFQIRPPCVLMRRRVRRLRDLRPGCPPAFAAQSASVRPRRPGRPCAVHRKPVYLLAIVRRDLRRSASAAAPLRQQRRPDQARAASLERPPAHSRRAAFQSADARSRERMPYTTTLIISRVAGAFVRRSPGAMPCSADPGRGQIARRASWATPREPPPPARHHALPGAASTITPEHVARAAGRHAGISDRAQVDVPAVG